MEQCTKITLEWYLAHYIKDRDKLDFWVYYLLIVVAFISFLYLDKIPAHAVVNDAVNIAKIVVTKRCRKNLSNAVLSVLPRKNYQIPETIKRKNKRYSVLYSLPVWLVKIN
mgnify:CR=1 FL=1